MSVTIPTVNTAETTYRVECRNGDARADFPGLDLARSVERCEAERAKGRWATVKIVAEATGKTVEAYHGAARIGART